MQRGQLRYMRLIKIEIWNCSMAIWFESFSASKHVYIWMSVLARSYRLDHPSVGNQK